MSTASQTSRLARRPSFVEVLESRRLLSAAPVASLGTLASVFADAEPDAGQQASIVARVVGGGTASFDFIPGLTSQFSVAATLYDDGTAHGHWICMIPAIVTISGRTLEGTLNADGSVSFAGTGNGIDHLLGGPFFDLPFTVRLWEGGPGVGRFLYDDPVVPDPGDFETVERGGIRIDAQQTAGAGQAMGFGATPIRASDPPDRIFDQVDSLKTDPTALNFYYAGESMSETQGDSRATQILVDQVRAGEADAFERLFARHRNYLHRVIDARLDRALRRRLDASDLIQEAHIEALRRLKEYLENPQVSFRLWLRQIVQDRLVMARRRHLGAARRAINRELNAGPDPSNAQLAELLASTSSPSQAAARNEMIRRVRQAIAQLPDADREILLMRSLEGLSNNDVAFILRIDPNTATKRHGRALLRLRAALMECE